MAIEEKANIDTLLIAAEVLERNLAKIRFQSKKHLLQGDPFVKNAQRRFSTSYTAPITSNVILYSPSNCPSSAPSRRHWLTSDLIISRTAVPIQRFPSLSENSLPNLKTVLSSPHSRSISVSSNTNSNNGSPSLVISSNPESPESWQVRSSTSPTEAPISHISVVATPTTASPSSFSYSVSDTANMLPLRQLRTALLDDRLVGVVKTQRSFSNINPPWSQLGFLTQTADLVNLAPESAVTSSEKAAPRLPAKKRKFDWDERSNGDSSLTTAPMLSTPSLSSQPPSASLIVDKPAQLGIDKARRSSFSELSDTTATFHYPAIQRGVSKLQFPVQQRKFSYPNLSSNCGVAGGVGSLRPPPISTFSSRNDVLPRRSSLVIAAHNFNNNNNIDNSTLKSASSSPSNAGITANVSRIWSPPSISKSGGGGDVWKGEFPFSTSSTGAPPLQRCPSHHSDAGRRYSVFGAPPSLASTLVMQHTAATGRHSSAASPALLNVPSSPSVAFNAPIPHQRQQQSQSFHEAKPLSLSPTWATEERPLPYGSSAGQAEIRPLSAPEEPVLPAWSLPFKADGPSTRSPASPLHFPIAETQTTTSRERQRTIGQVSVLGSILSSSSPIANTFAASTGEASYSQPPTYGLGDRKRSLDSVFPVTKTRDHGGAVLLTGNVCCRLKDKSFDGCFPLLLVSAPTSASAAEFAAAAAVNSGATASSLIPVPVQIVPSSVAGTTSSSPAANGDTGVALVSKTTNEADQRLVFPLMPVSTPDGQMSGCTLGIPLLVPSRLRHCQSP